MKLAVINGSPRRKGRTGIISQFIADTYEAEVMDLSKQILPIFNGEEEQNEIPDVKRLRRIVEEADGIILASPEYHSGMSGALKNALDFLNSQYFEHKPVALIAAAGGGKGGMNALNNMRVVVRGLYGNVIPKQIILDPSAFTHNGELTEEGMKAVGGIVSELKLYMHAGEFLRKETV